MSKLPIPFNKPYVTGQEFGFIQTAINQGQLSANGQFSRLCQDWLQESIGCSRAFLVHSGTAALELGALLMNLQPGDEVIMPSFTFVTTATAVVLRGGIPVFVDIRPDTLNIDEKVIEAAITPKTRAIMPVHYGGVGCAMERIAEVADAHDLYVFEDAAHTVETKYQGRPLGSFGDIAALSFHETKNITCGEGGALLINDESLIDRAEVLVEKGTDRRQFLLGQVDKYTWRDVGSSFLASEIEAAFLWAQIQEATSLTARRLAIWEHYKRGLGPLEKLGVCRLPIVPADCEHNGHVFYLLLNSKEKRDALLAHLRNSGIGAVFHYIPLHDSPGGKKFGRANGSLHNTQQVSDCLLRLPLWVEMTTDIQNRVIDAVFQFFGEKYAVKSEELGSVVS